ncbi:protein jim lovell isoform X2 [Anabrus simplex]|uniref:protein jim lovell isoform X2 n=1 Tax=Anabrus simplex TaxID=316456 RepID=UPI0034DCDC79
MLASQQFCVKWNSYSSNLQNVFPRLLNSEHFVDITLACEGQMIKCHKVVLSACSTYFERLLVHNPCQHPIIFMKDLKHWEVQALVDFMYKGEVNVSQDELNSLLAAAEALQIRGLCGSEHANRNHPDGNRQSNVSSGVTKIPSVSLPHDTVLSGSSSVGQDPQQLKRRRPPSVEKDQYSTLPKISNVTSTSPTPRGSSSSETSNITSSLLPVTDHIKTDIGADVLEEVPEKKAIKQEVDMDDNYPETELDADGPDDDYGNLEHQDDSDGNTRDEAVRQSVLDQPGPSGMIPAVGQPVDKAATVKDVAERPIIQRFETLEWNPTFRPLKGQQVKTDDKCWNVPGRPIRKDQDKLQLAAVEVLRGVSLRQAAETYKVPRTTLYDFMKRHGFLAVWPGSGRRRNFYSQTQ